MSVEADLLFPLAGFYEEAGETLPRFEIVEGTDVPEPYRRLLVHQRDMTPTLEAYFGARIHLDLLARRIDGGAYARKVALLLNGSDRRVEFGAIIIHCERFPEAARDVVLEGKVPLGTILADHAIPHGSAPRAFFQVRSDAVINHALGLRETHTLYGRRNVLAAPDGTVLADVLEILPPLEPK